MSAAANRAAGSWLVRCSAPSAGERLFCFPYAGGNPYLFREWPALLDHAYELFALQAPGKGARILEPPCQTIAALIDGLMPVIEPMLAQRSFSFYGHSNGAVIAFELACRLQQRGLPMPRHLILTGSPAPWTRVQERDYLRMPDESFVQVLRDLQGTPEEVLADHELLRLVMPGLRADFAQGQSYRFEHPIALDVATTLVHGEEDSFEIERTLAWQQKLVRPATLHRMPGGHFFIHRHMSELIALVGRTLRGEQIPDAERLSSDPASHNPHRTAQRIQEHRQENKLEHQSEHHEGNAHV
ncbi:thioesterase II family protein [Xanthomonas arboricola]|uniref:thioesterase II family protein n=1 Tax=Xanthomonas arboricola TaxID=56448 RepID=UPI00137AEE79|nr:thioesterase [Xanthomonas arboricola]